VGIKILLHTTPLTLMSCDWLIELLQVTVPEPALLPPPPPPLLLFLLLSWVSSLIGGWQDQDNVTLRKSRSIHLAEGGNPFLAIQRWHPNHILRRHLLLLMTGHWRMKRLLREGVVWGNDGGEIILFIFPIPGIEIFLNWFRELWAGIWFGCKRSLWDLWAKMGPCQSLNLIVFHQREIQSSYSNYIFHPRALRRRGAIETGF
jgi:hypothetical protein